MVNSEPAFPSASARRTAVVFGLAHWALLVLVQAENIGLRNLGWLPLMQGQNAVAALLVALLAWAAVRTVWSRWIFFVAFALVTVFVALDPGYYRLFTDHFRLSMGEGVRTMDPARGMSSFASIIDGAKGVLAVNAAFVLLTLAWLGWRSMAGKHRTSNIQHPTSNGAPARRQVHWMLGVGCWVLGVLSIASIPFAPFPATLANAACHPVYPLIQEALLPRVTTGLMAKAGDDTPVDAQSSTSPALAAAAAKIRAASPRPNVVLIILESVGAPQLLTASGLPDPQNTPNLAALAGSGVVFDHLYAVFPATVRNHLAINTGGFHLTWTSVFDVLHREFTGPLLGRDFGRAGYATALFSSERLDVEAMDKMEARAGWGTLYDFGRDVKNHVSANVLNSWSAREEFTMELIEPWIEEHRGGTFLLAYMNGATHHPYSVPRGYPQPNGVGTDRARYLNALHYTDDAIGRLVAMLKAQGLYENTIFAITGDHGEAFGEHPKNFAHKNALYDENVRTFLLLAHPALGTTERSDRVGMSGDIFPTLAALASLRVQTAGLDLLARGFPARSVGFTKLAFPEQWGRRDGRWKFIENIRERQPELYDLSIDPAEKQNVAAAHPDLAARLSAQCERWYLRTDAVCAAQFAGYTPADLQQTDVRHYGVKFITVSGQPPVATSVWIPDGKEHDLTLVWQAPDGTRHRAEQKLKADIFSMNSPCPAPPPMAGGEWSVGIEEGGRELLRTRFTAP
jgi:arylsulfatase A-like enzyme